MLRELDSDSTGATFWWVVAGVLLGSVIPFTLIVILPNNKQLLSPTLDRRSAKTSQLLARWGALHAVRSVPQWCGAAVVSVLIDFCEVSMRT